MTTHRFRFHHRGKKLPCPACGERTWRTYWDHKLNREANEAFGVCERINACQYVNYPKGGNMEEREEKPQPAPKMKDTSWRCPPEIVAMTGNSTGNAFAIWLVGLLGDKAKAALRTYRVGTYPASTKYSHLSHQMVYWHIGTDGLHRSGKVMAYDTDGHRRKDVNTDWVHRIVYGNTMEDLGCAQVLFGTHLLKERPNAPVCVVESEKTAIIASCFYPDRVWLATGGSHNLNSELCMCLAGSDVTLFPDTGMHQAWTDKAISIGLDVMCDKFRVDDTLEAMGAEPGSDIADYLLPMRILPELFSATNSTERITPEIAELPEGHKRPPFDWNAPDKPAKHSDQSPIERVFGSEGMQSLKNVFNIDLSEVSIKPLT